MLVLKIIYSVRKLYFALYLVRSLFSTIYPDCGGVECVVGGKPNGSYVDVMLIALISSSEKKQENFH